MAFSREVYDRLVEAYASLITEEMAVVIELDDGPNLTEIVRGELNGLSWHVGTVRFQIPRDVRDTFITRWTVYNADWVPIFETAVSETFVRGNTEVVLSDLSANINVPIPPTRLEQEQELINGI
jgi:hypothetical protein